jgi:hypothetical protein
VRPPVRCLWASAGVSCTNKANLPGRAGWDGVWRAWTGASCSNKPNLERPAAKRGVTVNKQSQLDRWPAAPNKANLLPAPDNGRGRRGRPGRRWVRMCKTNPIFGGARGYQSCETNPIARSGAPRRCLDCGLGTDLRRDACPAACGGQNVRNEPNFGRCGRRETPLFQYSSIPAFQSPRCRVGRGPRGVGRGAIVRTKPRSGSR